MGSIPPLFYLFLLLFLVFKTTSSHALLCVGYKSICLSFLLLCKRPRLGSFCPLLYTSSLTLFCMFNESKCITHLLLCKIADKVFHLQFGRELLFTRLPSSIFLFSFYTDLIGID